ncbi:SAM hydrolase/SAM-dependent halogenase family protein [Anatilimnocola floriformis]|uniref:SAM hydrolase/SAM-dependent halogenase family protein n=1 Tax=Anatilimnocola floriformis TaxID=2948575 RepID=UPI0020C3F454|nr:SAM-dependent chlorinase/fluorinase [Anatilimnocola floriformis]
MLITLTTDFGVSSPYVAAMKGSLLSTNAHARIVDLTHSIAPQNIRQAAVVLADVTPFFPQGTLHLVVVDPGVGTEREIIYAEFGEQRYLAPDNGVLSYLVRYSRPNFLLKVTESRYWRTAVSNTFHGRDIFAPVAGHLLADTSPNEMGRVTNQMIWLDWPEPHLGTDSATAEVLYIDSFGNVITNLTTAMLRGWLSSAEPLIRIAGREITGLQTTYGQRGAGELIALGDSQGRLEIAVVNGNAAAQLGVEAGDSVQITRKSL